jgi:hypothetical protein
VNGKQTFTEEEYKQVFARIEALMPWDTAWASTVVILITRGKSLQVLGSGTLLKIGEESLLVTATHVIEDAGAVNLCIIRANQTRKEDIIPLEADAILSDRDGLDVAVLRLKPNVAANFTNKDYLRLDQFCCEKEDLSEAMFAVIGFPKIMAGQENGILKFTKFFHVAPAFEGNGFAFRGFSPDAHFLVDADLAETRTIDGKPMEFRTRQGQEADFPGELGGISGGSVWKLGDNPIDLAQRTPRSGKLVGVITGTYSNTTCMLASRWSSVMEMLRDAIPEIRGELICCHPRRNDGVNQTRK